MRLRGHQGPAPNLPTRGPPISLVARSQPVASSERSRSPESSCIRCVHAHIASPVLPDGTLIIHPSPCGHGVRCAQCHQTAGRTSPSGPTGTLKATAPACSSQNPSSPPRRPHGQIPETSGVIIGISVCVAVHADPRDPVDDASELLLTFRLLRASGLPPSPMADSDPTLLRKIRILLSPRPAPRSTVGEAHLAPLHLGWVNPSIPSPPGRFSCLANLAAPAAGRARERSERRGRLCGGAVVTVRAGLDLQQPV
jgi:hypothetical protein